MKNIANIVNEIEKEPIENNGHIYHPIPFVEFEHLKTSLVKEEFLKKAEIILNYIYTKFNEKLNDIHVLDIGANGGYFSFTLSKDVKQVTAFETNIRYTEVSKAIINEKAIDNIDWKHSPFNVELVKDKSGYDVTLMLSVFQWMAEGGHNIESALKDLKFISQISECLIFELGFNQGKSAIRTDNKDHYEALINLLKINTIYTSFELIGVSEFWRDSKRYIVACTK